MSSLNVSSLEPFKSRQSGTPSVVPFAGRPKQPAAFKALQGDHVQFGFFQPHNDGPNGSNGGDNGNGQDPNQPQDPHDDNSLWGRMNRAIGCLSFAMVPLFLIHWVMEKLFRPGATEEPEAQARPQGIHSRPINGGLGSPDTETRRLPKIRSERPKERLNMVAGIPEIIDTIQHDVIDLFVNRGKTYVDEELPRGLLFKGPPGTGKTHLARAIAGELGVPFYSMSGSDFIEMYVGLGAARVRNLFKEARKTGGIIFIDELDAIGGKRSSGDSGKADSERVQTLNALLQEMNDLSDENNDNLLIIAATNRPESLDKALTRAGRFDRSYTINPPMTPEARAAIFKVQKQAPFIDPKVDLVDFSRKYLFPGTTGADIAKVLREAALQARREAVKLGIRGQHVIKLEHLQKAVELELGVPRKGVDFSSHDMDVIARHEAIGHGLVSFAHGIDPNFVTIVPREGSLGMVLSSPEKVPQHLQNRDYFEKRISLGIGAQLSEKLAYGEKGVHSGASGDLKQVNSLAAYMIEELNLYPQLTKGLTIDRDGPFANASESTLREFDQYRQQIIDEISRKTEAFLKAVPKGAIDNILRTVKQKQTISGPDAVGAMYNAPENLALLKKETGCDSWSALWKKATNGLSKYTSI